MPVSVVVGGQYGSEGKGKVAAWLAGQRGASIVVRVGGPNSGHTVVDGSGRTHIFRQLPTAAVLPGVRCAIAAGSYLDVDILHEEIRHAEIGPRRLTIDGRAVLIEARDKITEADLAVTIGSTATGTGAAILRRISRSEAVRFAKDEASLRPFIADVSELVAAARNERTIIEGTQGFGLSLLHGPDFPYVTARDTTASSFASEVGVSTFDIDEVVMVLRCHPIRVGGNSGPLNEETSWCDLSERAGRPVVEYTTVTKRMRRVGQFDGTLVREAIVQNRPTCIILNHLDYVQSAMRSSFVSAVEHVIQARVDYVGLGPACVEKRESVARAV